MTAAGYAARAENLLDEAGDRSNSNILRQTDALRGIGYALLAIGEHLADGNDGLADAVVRLEQLADTGDELAAGQLRARRRWPWSRCRRCPQDCGCAAPAASPTGAAQLAEVGRNPGGTPACGPEETGEPAVPGITVPRYAAPRVSVTPVTEVVSTEPADGRRPGHYQQVLLNTKTSELRFHESTEHLEARDPSWLAATDITPETWNRWHPGKLFTLWGGPHMWFEPVPELLCWVVDSGTPAFPYLDAAAASDLLGELALYAQTLLDWLFHAADELDWSAHSVCMGRAIGRRCSSAKPTTDVLVARDAAGLADYGDIVRRFPQVFQPRLLQLQPDALARECEWITRFLGVNEHWHPEVMEAFGTPYRDGSGMRLDVLGVRAWYQTARAAGAIA